jgi:hypothetical protein
MPAAPVDKKPRRTNSGRVGSRYGGKKPQKVLRPQRGLYPAGVSSPTWSTVTEVAVAIRFLRNLKLRACALAN